MFIRVCVLASGDAADVAQAVRWLMLPMLTMLRLGNADDAGAVVDHVVCWECG